MISFLLATAMTGDFCASFEGMAESIMSARQAGASMSELMALFDNTTPQVQRIGYELVILAYRHPVYSTERLNQQQAREFAAQAASICYRAAIDFEDQNKKKEAPYGRS